jgi:hypothetical protein
MRAFLSFLRRIKNSGILILGFFLTFSVHALDGFPSCGERYVVNDRVVSVFVSLVSAARLQSYLDCIAAGLASNKQRWRSVQLELPEGKIRLVTPLVLPQGFIATGTALTLESGKGQVSTLSGAILLTGWQLLDATQRKSFGIGDLSGVYRVRIPKDAASLIRQGISRDHGQKLDFVSPELIVDGEIYEVAKWPSTGFLKVFSGGNDQFSVSREFLPPHLESNSLYVHGFFFHDWADSQRKIAQIDYQSGIIKLMGPPVRYGIKAGGRFVIANSPSFIRKNGDYAISPDSDELIFLSNTPPSVVELTITASVFKGRAQKIRVSKLTVEGVTGNAIDLIGDDNEISDVGVRNVGLIGVRINGFRNVVRSSKVHAVGSIGVELVGGDRRLLTESNATLVGSTVEDFGRLVWSANPGVRVFGVGINVRGNIIRYGPHAGIFYFGNEHRIENNEVYEVARLTDDVGAIYTGQDWTGRGNKVVANYVHDVHGVGHEGATAFYLDDQASGILVEENVAWNVDRGFLVGGGRNNEIRRNVVVQAKECLKIDARAMTNQGAATRVGQQLRERLHAVPYNDGLYKEKYPDLANVLSDRPGLPVGNVVENNLGDCDVKGTDLALQGSRIDSFKGLGDMQSVNGNRAPTRQGLQRYQRDWGKAMSEQVDVD